MKIQGIKVLLWGRLRTESGRLVAWRYDEESHSELLPIYWNDQSWEIEGRPSTRQPDYSALDRKEWDENFHRWRSAVLESAEYQNRKAEIIQQQKVEPFWFRGFDDWLCTYQGKIYRVDGPAAPGLDREELSLLVKHFVVSQQVQFKKLSREIQAFENLKQMTYREIIPESVRLFVWQRDQGKCVECSSREALEFDHIIPVADGGSSTERNVQLLCMRCNRKKGKNVA